MDTVEVARPSYQDATWVPPLGGFQGTSDCEDTLRQTKNLLGRLQISPGIPQEEQIQVCWAKGCLVESTEPAATATWPQIMLDDVEDELRSLTAWRKK